MITFEISKLPDMDALKFQNDSNKCFEISRSLEMGALKFQDNLKPVL